MDTRVYFVTTGLQEEIQVLRRVRPPRLLCSFWYFRNKPLRAFCEDLGYTPEIILDSGAYSAFTKGKNVNVLDYMAYIKENAAYISWYVTLDVIGDSLTTGLLYNLMKAKGFDPVPVVHFGEDLLTLQQYVEAGEKRIALGNTVRIRDKNVVASWCADIHAQYLDIELHLLGSSSQKILQSGALTSCDSCAWYLMAINGKPKDIPGKTQAAKMARAEANLLRTMEVFNENPVPIHNNIIKPGHGKI